ncbi:spermidine synthase [Flavobacterium sp. 3HN19-14]|uniref:spermidine synthase n=1 Tax=Flavobacterium sp. 3HN19-14 TaxID=3448133 RepID=UPI003EDFB51C
MLKKWLSYLIPITVFEKKSEWSKNIEVTWNNGELVMDSKNTNYSYGSLQRILRKGLKKIGYDRIIAMENILVLGVAGGSVIKTITSEINYKGRITGVDIDENVIAIANKYFALDKIPNLEIVIDDAFEFVLKTKEKYDLIIIDIFQDTTMPNFLFESFFVRRIGFLLAENGVAMFNTMLLNQEDNIRNQHFISELEKLNLKTTIIPRVEQHNELILFELAN